MKYLIQKFCTLIITLFIVSFLAFAAFQLIGDPTTAMLGTNATPEQIAELQHTLGLDRPLLVRYGEWLLHFLQGDMGVSYSYNLPVADMVGMGRQTAVLAFNFADGWTNYILPHSSALMGFIGMAGIPYDRWMKFFVKLFVIWVVTSMVILAFAGAIGYT